MEHHSNIVPWLMLKKEIGIDVEFISITESGDLDEDSASRLLAKQPKLLSFTHVSNALGTLNDVRHWVSEAKKVGALTLVDGAQAVSALPVNVSDLDVDFYVMSGHKVFGPTGIGLLYGRKSLLEKMPPYQGGGSMIQEVTKEAVTFLPPPQKFEAGTCHIAGVIGLESAIEFIDSLDWQEIRNHEYQLTNFLVEELSNFEGLRFIGNPQERINVVSFALDGSHPSDVGVLLDQQGVAVRTGHHCCQPLMARFGIPGTVRVSVSLYNTLEEIKQLVTALRKAQELLQ
ncbi:MAG: cysteine desulfurase, partial [Bdellovibrionales bacterium]|nr:cysteine desulfurase [Bdellovibrionales bacterium]